MMPPTSFVYGIPRFAVTRPVTVLMLLLTMLVLGFITATRIPLSLFPEGYQNNRLFINANYPNASPRDVEEKVTRKIEDVNEAMAEVLSGKVPARLVFEF